MRSRATAGAGAAATWPTGTVAVAGAAAPTAAGTLEDALPAGPAGAVATGLPGVGKNVAGFPL